LYIAGFKTEMEEIKMQSCDWSSMVEKEEKREERRVK